MPTYTIRQATVHDAPALAALAAKTFSSTFGNSNSAEDLATYLKSAYGVSQQTAEIQDPSVVTLLGFKGDDLLGFAQIRNGLAPKCVAIESPIELQRLYVDHSAHGSGLALQLMQHAQTAASSFGGTHLWLGVWEFNPRAIAFYRKVGFFEVGSQVFLFGSDPQRDLVMVGALSSLTIDPP